MSSQVQRPTQIATRGPSTAPMGSVSQTALPNAAALFMGSPIQVSPLSCFPPAHHAPPQPPRDLMINNEADLLLDNPADISSSNPFLPTSPTGQNDAYGGQVPGQFPGGHSSHLSYTGYKLATYNQNMPNSATSPIGKDPAAQGFGTHHPQGVQGYGMPTNPGSQGYGAPYAMTHMSQGYASQSATVSQVFSQPGTPSGPVITQAFGQSNNTAAQGFMMQATLESPVSGVPNAPMSQGYGIHSSSISNCQFPQGYSTFTTPLPHVGAASDSGMPQNVNQPLSPLWQTQKLARPAARARRGGHSSSPSSINSPRPVPQQPTPGGRVFRYDLPSPSSQDRQLVPYGLQLQGPQHLGHYTPGNAMYTSNTGGGGDGVLWCGVYL